VFYTQDKPFSKARKLYLARADNANESQMKDTASVWLLLPCMCVIIASVPNKLGVRSVIGKKGRLIWNRDLLRALFAAHTERNQPQFVYL
jgi:hypothetical protein